jgi:aminoglycoside 2''-phosphotransferase
LKEFGVNKEWRYATQIRRHYPELSIETVRFNQEGQYNDVLVVNEALIFRFARYPAAVQTLQQEVAILRAIQEQVTLPVPDPIYQNLTTQAVGESFVGYRMLPGEPLWRDKFQAVGKMGRRRMARQLALFLGALHGVSVAEAGLVEPPVADTRDTYADLYGRIRRRLFQYMRPEAKKQVTNHFKSFLDNRAAYQFEPRLRHGDFGTGNLLFDPQAEAITGVIDFGSAGPGDPATDFAGVLASFGEAFFRQCAHSYPEMAHAWPRVQFYVGTYALQEALFGVENGDEEAFASGIAGYI